MKGLDVDAAHFVASKTLKDAHTQLFIRLDNLVEKEML
jgi:hypothetical protein